MVDYTWPAKACPCGSYQCAECQENDCEWVLDPSLVPVALRTTKPGVLEYESWSAVSGVGAVQVPAEATPAMLREIALRFAFDPQQEDFDMAAEAWRAALAAHGVVGTLKESDRGL